jgi:hypothetical protein
MHEGGQQYEHSGSTNVTVASDTNAIKYSAK